jgi:hypothetical protein
LRKVRSALAISSRGALGRTSITPVDMNLLGPLVKGAGYCYKNLLIFDGEGKSCPAHDSG